MGRKFPPLWTLLVKELRLIVQELYYTMCENKYHHKIKFPQDWEHWIQM